MCGIAGLFSSQWNHSENIETVALNMAERLAHRGPDDFGVWSEFGVEVAMAHRRLSIVDLSESGHQPMLSHCSRYVIVFNGEIYNHLEIRRALEVRQFGLSDNSWRGYSDTETLLTAISHWGLEAAIKRCVGMFAFALWDRNEKSLYLVRDRVGEKPLYYGYFNKTFIFGSEIKALQAYPGIQLNVDRTSLGLFLQHNAVPAPYSIYDGVKKLIPGTILKVTLDDLRRNKLSEPVKYWSVISVAEEAQRSKFHGDLVEAGVELERLLKRSVQDQMQADVPLGAFLSGGIDSTAVVAMMQAQSSCKQQTFTIGFKERNYDEADHARAVASYLGTSHTELFVTANDALATIPLLTKLYDEPFADVSQIPTYLVSELARKDVKVCLTGDGGDEIFGGYNRYMAGGRVWRGLGWMPLRLRSNISDGILAIPPTRWDSVIQSLSGAFPRRLHHRSAGDKLHKFAEMLSANTAEEIYSKVASNFQSHRLLHKVSSEQSVTDLDMMSCMNSFEIEHQMMLRDFMGYLPNDILVKTDRAAMGVSLETRMPMLDHRIIEFAWSLPLSMKIHNGKGKLLLKEVLNNYVPMHLIDRPKAGFGVPMDLWLRGPLKEWASELLDPHKIKSDGFFVPNLVNQKWNEHLSGMRNNSKELWALLSFQAWNAQRI